MRPMTGGEKRPGRNVCDPYRTPNPPCQRGFFIGHSPRDARPLKGAWESARKFIVGVVGCAAALAGTGGALIRVCAGDFKWLGKNVRAGSYGGRGRRKRRIPREPHRRALRLLRFQCADG